MIKPKPSLEKRCINKTFPQLVIDEDDKCQKPSCRGYDQYCPRYAPTSSYNVQVQNQLEGGK